MISQDFWEAELKLPGPEQRELQWLKPKFAEEAQWG